MHLRPIFFKNMKKLYSFKCSILAILFFLISYLSLQAQCNMGMTDLEIQRYHEHMESYRSKLKTMRGSGVQASIMFVPITIHVINKNDGTGGETQSNILKDLELLNRTFTLANLKFYVCGNINYINSSTYFDYADTIPSTDLPTSYNVPNTINIIYYNSIYLKGFGDAGGFASFPGGPMRIYMNSGSGGYTLPHEMGHFWGLPHTFQGSNSNNPNFKELVTRGVGANCTVAGDAICDTPADPYVYSSGRTYISKCVYIDTLRDANRDLYSPMVNNIMSYYISCANAFTQGQHNVMESYKTNTSRNTWSTTCPTVNAPTGLLASVDPKYGIKITWNDNASNELGYELEMSKGGSNNFVTVEILPANRTSSYFGQISSNSTYYFRVKPINTAASYSNVANVTTNKAYCIPMNTTNCINNSFIINGSPALIGIGKIDIDAENKFENNSNCSPMNGYELYNSGRIKIIKGIPYKLNISYLSSAIPRFYGWIDLNDDGNFDETQEKLIFSEFPASATIKINNTVQSGIKRLRIRATDINESNISPCGYLQLGETEDYLIELIDNPTTNPVQLSASYNGIYTTNLTWINSSLPSNTKCLLYTSDNDKGQVFLDTLILSQNGFNTIVSSNGTHSFLLRKANDHSLISNIATIIASNIVYCVPKYSNKCTLPSDAAIERVTILGENLLNNNTGCSSSSFARYSNPVVKLYKGINYSISLVQSKLNGGWTGRSASFWVDYNNNGSFDDANEKSTLKAEDFSTIFSGSILPPISTPIGIKNLRVRLHNNSNGTSCQDDYVGETEDYLIELMDLPASFPVTLNVSQNSPYSTSLIWNKGGLVNGTKCYIYKSIDNQAFIKVDSANIEQVNLSNLIYSNGNYKYLLRRASDNQIISNIASVNISNYSNPFQISAKKINNIIRIEWNKNNIVTKAELFRTLSNYQGYFIKIGSIDPSKGYYDDIQIMNGDTMYTYNVRTIEDNKVISNNVSIKITNSYCIPTFRNTSCVNDLFSYIDYKVDPNSFNTMAYNPYCFPSNNKFIEPSPSNGKIDTLYPNYSYNFNVFTQSGCINNIPTSNFRNLSIWIDYNENQIFEPTELIYSNPQNSYSCFYSIPYVVASSTEGGLKRLRYIFTDKNYPITDACGNYTYGTGYDKFFYIKTPDITAIDQFEKIDQADEITLFPNPSENGRFAIQSRYKVSKIRIFNTIGVEVYNGVPTDSPTLEAGMYIIEVKTDSRLASSRIKFISK